MSRESISRATAKSRASVGMLTLDGIVGCSLDGEIDCSYDRQQ